MKTELTVTVKRAITALISDNSSGAITPNDIRESFYMLIEAIEEKKKVKRKKTGRTR